jgi:hypothetical protein
MIFDQADIIQRILFHVAFAPSPLANGSWPTRRKDSCQKAQHWLDDPEAEKSLPWEWLNWEDVRKSILVNRTFYSEGSRLLWRWLRFGVHHGTITENAFKYSCVNAKKKGFYLFSFLIRINIYLSDIGSKIDYLLPFFNR